MIAYGGRYLNLSRFVVLAALVALLALPMPSRADSVRGEMTKLAKKAIALLKQQEKDAIAVGEFVGPAQIDSNSGPGFQQMLIEELEKLQHGVVQKRADLSVRGRYARIDLEGKENDGLIAVKLTAEFCDKKDDAILKVAMEFTDTKDIARLLGATVSLPPDGSKKERHQEIVKRLERPDVFVHPDKFRISSSAESPYTVEVLAKPVMAKGPAQPRRAKEIIIESGGKEAFVDVKIGEMYEVRVCNNSAQEVGVTLAIDGLDVFTFSEDRTPNGEPKFTRFVVGKGESRTIVGWHKTTNPARKDNFLSFLVVQYGQGGASKFPSKSQGKVGTLTVSFANAYPLGRSGAETGFGPPREVKQTPVQRSFDPPHDFVTIRYYR